MRETDDAVLVFSSGTTDRPKAVRHTHRSIGRRTDALVSPRWASGHDDRFQVATPPSHILGLLNLLAAAAAEPPSGCTADSTSTRSSAGSKRSG